MIDCFIVFGASVKLGGRPSATMEARVNAALERIIIASDYIIIPTGGIVTNPPEESMLMKRLFISAGIPKESIFQESKSTDTFSSVLNCIAVINNEEFSVGNIYICTSSYHIPRCILIFWILGKRVKVGGVAKRPHKLPAYKYMYICLKEIPATIKDCTKAIYFRLKRKTSGV